MQSKLITKAGLNKKALNVEIISGGRRTPRYVSTATQEQASIRGNHEKKVLHSSSEQITQLINKLFKFQTRLS